MIVQRLSFRHISIYKMVPFKITQRYKSHHELKEFDSNVNLNNRPKATLAHSLIKFTLKRIDNLIFPNIEDEAGSNSHPASEKSTSNRIKSIMKRNSLQQELFHLNDINYVNYLSKFNSYRALPKELKHKFQTTLDPHYQLQLLLDFNEKENPNSFIKLDLLLHCYLKISNNIDDAMLCKLICKLLDMGWYQNSTLLIRASGLNINSIFELFGKIFQYCENDLNNRFLFYQLLSKYLECSSSSMIRQILQELSLETELVDIFQLNNNLQSATTLEELLELEDYVVQPFNTLELLKMKMQFQDLSTANLPGELESSGLLNHSGVISQLVPKLHGNINQLIPLLENATIGKQDWWYLIHTSSSTKTIQHLIKILRNRHKGIMNDCTITEHITDRLLKLSDTVVLRHYMKYVFNGLSAVTQSRVLVYCLKHPFCNDDTEFFTETYHRCQSNLQPLLKVLIDRLFPAGEIDAKHYPKLITVLPAHPRLDFFPSSLVSMMVKYLGNNPSVRNNKQLQTDILQSIYSIVERHELRNQISINRHLTNSQGFDPERVLETFTIKLFIQLLTRATSDLSSYKMFASALYSTQEPAQIFTYMDTLFRFVPQGLLLNSQEPLSIMIESLTKSTVKDLIATAAHSNKHSKPQAGMESKILGQCLKHLEKLTIIQPHSHSLPSSHSDTEYCIKLKSIAYLLEQSTIRNIEDGAIHLKQLKDQGMRVPNPLIRAFLSGLLKNEQLPMVKRLRLFQKVTDQELYSHNKSMLGRKTVITLVDTLLQIALKEEKGSIYRLLWALKLAHRNKVDKKYFVKWTETLRLMKKHRRGYWSTQNTSKKLNFI
ncbi:BA75_03702T0 [Komagataella pastoris]|uniref:BA75_03702T0 n=1 Tax=Komagataella pastoris TaxID=4922 RepID=A0A1B2JEP6_PICPA|nr:BA75_03702T0 [Komagataella pastoris]